MIPLHTVFEVLWCTCLDVDSPRVVVTSRIQCYVQCRHVNVLARFITSRLDRAHVDTWSNRLPRRYRRFVRSAESFSIWLFKSLVCVRVVSYSPRFTVVPELYVDGTRHIERSCRGIHDVGGATR